MYEWYVRTIGLLKHFNKRKFHEISIVTSCLDHDPRGLAGYRQPKERQLLHNSYSYYFLQPSQNQLTMAKLRLLISILLPLMGSSFSSHSSFLARPNDRFRVVTRNAAAASLSMHMGHSHSHHHHGHGHDNNAAAPLPVRPTSVRRKISLVIFAACVVLAPRILMKKTISRAHSATFILTCTALGMMDQIRGGFYGMVEKLKVSYKR